MNNTARAIFFAFFGALFLGFYYPAFAVGIVPCGLSSNDPCTLCHLIVGIKNLMDWGMAILITISVTAIALGGITYVVSSGDPELTKKAKGFVTSAVIGFSLMLGAWLIINTTLWLFAAKGDLGLGEGKNWYTFTCSTTSSSTGTTTSVASAETATATTETVTSFDCNDYTFQTGIKTQCTDGDASTALQTMMVCLKNSSIGSKMTINSISDSAGLSFCQNSYAKPPCAHAENSCHYGGSDGGKSEAIDISTKTGLDVSTITSAANGCNAGYIKDESKESNHVHVSTTACKND
jgi:hypothetical protein